MSPTQPTRRGKRNRCRVFYGVFRHEVCYVLLRRICNDRYVLAGIHAAPYDSREQFIFEVACVNGLCAGSCGIPTTYKKAVTIASILAVASIDQHLVPTNSSYHSPGSLRSIEWVGQALDDNVGTVELLNVPFGE